MKTRFEVADIYIELERCQATTVSYDPKVDMDRDVPLYEAGVRKVWVDSPGPRLARALVI